MDRKDVDDALMARVAAGDSQAWPTLVNRHLRGVVAYAWSILGDGAEAEDVAQETFVRLMRKAPQWQPGAARLRTWLFRVATNLCIDRLRMYRPEGMESAGDVAAEGYGERITVRRMAQNRAVGEALAKLPDRQRIALTLVHYHGLSNGEAAKILAVSVDAVESLLSRARRSLRTYLAPVVRELLEDNG